MYRRRRRNRSEVEVPKGMKTTPKRKAGRKGRRVRISMETKKRRTRKREIWTKRIRQTLGAVMNAKSVVAGQNRKVDRTDEGIETILVTGIGAEDEGMIRLTGVVAGNEIGNIEIETEIVTAATATEPVIVIVITVAIVIVIVSAKGVEITEILVGIDGQGETKMRRMRSSERERRRSSSVRRRKRSDFKQKLQSRQK